MFGKFFGAKKEEGPPPPTLDEAQESVQRREDALSHKIRDLERDISQVKSQMAKMKPGPAKEQLKRKALGLLRRRKQYEQQREQLSAQGYNLHQTNFVAQSLQDTKLTVDAMRSASASMKTEMKAIEVDEVYDMQDDMQELMDQHFEIQEAMSRTYDTPDAFGDDELEAELDALDEWVSEEEAPAWLSQMPTAASASSVAPPSTQLHEPSAPLMN